MRRVANNSSIWREPGIASTHAATLMGCSEDWAINTPLKLWADRVSLRRKIEVKKVPELAQSGSDWHDYRAKGVGGSEVAAVLGQSRFANPQSVWKEKVAAKSGSAQTSFENADMKRGKELEPKARAQYESLMGWTSPPLCVIHDLYDFVRCSLDGLREPADDLVLEIKAPRENGHAKALRVKADPSSFRQLIPHYFCQVQYQLLITNAPLAHFVSYCESGNFGPDSFCLVEVPADAAYQQEILDRVRWFWDYVEREEPPPTL